MENIIGEEEPKKKKMYTVSARFYQGIEASSADEAYELFENSGMEDMTLDSSTLTAELSDQ